MKETCKIIQKRAVNYNKSIKQCSHLSRFFTDIRQELNVTGHRAVPCMTSHLWDISEHSCAAKCPSQQTPNMESTCYITTKKHRCKEYRNNPLFTII